MARGSETLSNEINKLPRHDPPVAGLDITSGR